MVSVLVVLTFAALVAFDWFVLRRGYLEEKAGWPAKLESLPAGAAEQQVPAGVFLQPTYTWSRVGEWGGVYVGVHPMLLRLIGESGEIELRAPGERVEKGDALVSIWRGGHHLTLRSPLTGRVDRLNRHASDQARWFVVEESGGPWLYHVRPERVAEEVPRWFSGAAALDWTRRQWQQLGAYLQSVVPAGHLGTVMADGGEPPLGILGEMDDAAWTGLERRFLAPAAEGGEGRP